MPVIFNFLDNNIQDKFENIWIEMNIDQCIADLLEAKCLHEKDLRILCEKVK